MRKIWFIAVLLNLSSIAYSDDTSKQEVIILDGQHLTIESLVKVARQNTGFVAKISVDC